jgi:16S rRNA (cytidine1402-2'-O)-methyltransferase
MPEKDDFICEGLYLFPVPITEEEGGRNWIGPDLVGLVKRAKLVFAENERSARRFISSLKTGLKIESLQVERLDKNTSRSEIADFLKMLKDSGSALLMSESGCPAIADPGSMLVDACHKAGIPVHPLTGPSSIILALMASGLNGQSFAFHGYLPVDRKQCAEKIRILEKESRKENRTQIFIETPYRNASIWNNLVEHLQEDTKLCFAKGLGASSGKIGQKKVAEWKKAGIQDWEKTPCVFLFLAE